MLAEKKKATNVGIGVGLGLEVVGVVLVVSGRPLLLLLALPVMLVSIVFFAWGCWSYAAGKGYPGVLGLVGVFFGVIGLLILILLPDKCKDGHLPSALPVYQFAPYAAQSTAPTHGAYPATPAPAFGGATAGGYGAARYAGPGNGNGGSATKRPPMGGGGAAGWDEGTSQFVVPQSVVPIVSVPTAASVAPPSFEVHPQNVSVETPAESDSYQSPSQNYGDYSPAMRSRTPPTNHWSVRQPA